MKQILLPPCDNRSLQKAVAVPNGVIMAWTPQLMAWQASSILYMPTSSSLPSCHNTISTWWLCRGAFLPCTHPCRDTKFLNSLVFPGAALQALSPPCWKYFGRSLVLKPVPERRDQMETLPCGKSVGEEDTMNSKRQQRGTICT